DRGDHLVHVARVRVVAGEMTQLLAHGGAPLLTRRLQDDAQPCLVRQVRAAWVRAEHRHLTRAAGTVPLEDLDRGRLAGAVRAEEGEGLASPDLEIDTTHGL